MKKIIYTLVLASYYMVSMGNSSHCQKSFIKLIEPGQLMADNILISSMHETFQTVFFPISLSSMQKYYINGQTIILSASEQGEAWGWLSYKTYKDWGARYDAHEDHGELIVEITSIQIRPRFQGKGILTNMLQELLASQAIQRPFQLKLITQNMHVEAAIRHVLNELAIASRLIKRTKYVDYYGRQLSTFLAPSRDLALNDIYSQLNIAKGDAFSIIYSIDL